MEDIAVRRSRLRDFVIDKDWGYDSELVSRVRCERLISISGVHRRNLDCVKTQPLCVILRVFRGEHRVVICDRSLFLCVNIFWEVACGR